ncbi:hypothetical protein R1sor_007895 [Riccia sorocarpa]|uniref:Uncharacterized protein n=1 Tax=Riccia sorocarpa TaxID=122646 RepID=A0ABD3HV89_9MARC
MTSDESADTTAQLPRTVKTLTMGVDLVSLIPQAMKIKKQGRNAPHSVRKTPHPTSVRHSHARLALLALQSAAVTPSTTS